MITAPCFKIIDRYGWKLVKEPYTLAWIRQSNKAICKFIPHSLPVNTKLDGHKRWACKICWHDGLNEPMTAEYAGDIAC